MVCHVTDVLTLSNTRSDAAKLKWNGVRCLFEDAQSDILLLLDTCAVRDAPLAGSHGLKQAIAAYSPEQSLRDAGSRSFTASLTDSLAKLSAYGRPFSAHRLYEDLLAQRQQDAAAQPRLTNGNARPTPTQERVPVSFTMTPGQGQNISLAPLPPKAPSQPLHQPAETDSKAPPLSREDSLIKPSTAVDLMFDEARVLVCTTFVGDASLDMTFFNQWLHDSPPVASKIAVEGMFIGPPTMLLISMPHSIWNVVQHDKVCCFLGYISSHNMIHLYKDLLGSTPANAASLREVEDGRILLEAREAAAASPSVIRRDPSGAYPVLQPDTPTHAEPNGRDPLPIGLTPDKLGLPHGSPINTAGKDEVEDSAEMQEAAEQLKALSHVRHLSDGTPSKLEHKASQLVNGIEVARDDMDSAADSGADETNYSADYGMPGSASKPKARKPLAHKPPSKPETRCTFCSHVPFKDSSSLRKHIAAAHTRPFPCAFAFAGCTSTFGSKNEWKRHIASQHLCLTFYRCTSCPQSTAEGKGNEFNRKDLFTQHLRRMHAPFAVKKSIAKGDSKMQLEWDAHVKVMQQTCLVVRRQPPMKSACPKAECQTVFEGVGSWDEWTEHVGRHMERGEAQRMGVDRLLAQWALDENIIEQKEDGEYKLCSQGNGAGEKDSSQLQHQATNGGAGNNQSFISDAGKQDDDDPSITVAMPGQASEKMDID